MQLDPSGRLLRWENFDEDQFDAALARLDELGAADSRTPLAENAAARLGHAGCEFIVTGRLDELRELLADDFVRHDRRTGVSAADANRDEYLASARVIVEVGFSDIRNEFVAVRGERLGLARAPHRSADGAEMVFLSLTELDASGRLRRQDQYDEDDLATALAELDARYLAGEGAEHAALLGHGVDHSAALFARDWDALAVTMADDFVGVDHRGLWPDLDRDGYIARMRSLGETADGVVVARKQHIASRAVLATCDVHATGAHGDAYSYSFHLISVSNDQGLLARFEYFDEDQFDAALARLDQLGAPPASTLHPRVENATTLAVDRFFDLVIAGRFDDAAEELVPHIVRVDHRITVSDATTHGRDEYMAALRSTFEVGFASVRVDHLAVRGERLALFRSSFTTDSGMQLMILSVGESDADGRVSSLALYEEDALDDAVADLDARFAAGEGRPHAEILGTVAGSAVCVNARNWAGIRSVYSEHFTFVDYTPVGWPELDLDGFIEIQQSYADQVQLKSLLQSARVEGRAFLGTAVTVGTDPDGGEFEWVYHGVSTFDADQRYSRSEMYAEDDFATALARFDELAADARPADPRHPRAENTATRQMDRYVEYAQARDVDGTRSIITEDFVRLDRRAGVAAPDAHGPEELAEALYAWFDVGMDRLEAVPLAVRGERLALFRVEFRAEDGRNVLFVSVWETDDFGRFVRAVHFDEHALADAVDELDARALLELDESAPHFRLLSEFPLVSKTNHRDWSTILDPAFPDFTHVDRRQLGWPTVDRHGWVATMTEYVDLAADLVLVPRKYHACGSAALNTVDAFGTTPDGSPIEWCAHSVVAFGEGGQVSIEAFDEKDFLAALARLDELGANPPAATRPMLPTVENAVTRRNAEWVEAKNAGRSTELEHLIAPGYTVVSHRFGGIVPVSEGVDQMRALSSAGDEIGFTLQTVEPIAVQGERLAVMHLTATTADGYLSERLEVTEIDEQGRFMRTEIFDLDAIADANATLNRWHLEQALPARMFEAGVVRLDALDRGDRDAVLATYAPDFVREDRRRGVNFGTSNREETVDALLAGNDVGLANREFTVVEVVGDHFVLVEFRMSHDDGFELVYLLAPENDETGKTPPRRELRHRRP